HRRGSPPLNGSAGRGDSWQPAGRTRGSKDGTPWKGGTSPATETDAPVSTAVRFRASGSSRMRSTCLALAVLLGALAPSIAAAAQRVELAGRVTASRTVLSQRRVGEARYVAISDLFYRDGSAIVEVLDLSTQSVVQVTARRSLFERKFGVSRNGTTAPPQAEVVLYRDGIVGLGVASGARGGL